ncbi:S8 family serine peptidase [Pontibacillus yanchengensis]|uniref:S8 family serine peptidase n=2 Tax=Pontibacillus yanchengensis TaxID=462910 RepID=A0ACC7VCD1_9BACI|nr:S8 family peptidase [Pontibacillus yanchengensis]MYL35397.1 S8 family serine peptidase [Pontibacillus yanchengensis]MYL52428.1 S8 family serine peptidase [Pontibacillus yanchengensis]
MKPFQLIPFRVNEIHEQSNEIPQGVKMIEAPSMWKHDVYGNGIVVAVIDSGCDVNHPDLRKAIIDGRNFTGGNPRDVSDGNGHGTHVAGTIAASLNNKGVAGVAPSTKLLILKTFDENGNASYENIVKAVKYANKWRGPRGERVRVISMSFGGSQNSAMLHRAIKNAVENDILVVCAAGNAGDGNEQTTEKLYPGYYKEVVQVGAVDFNGDMADFTNTNDEIDIVAPGVGIRSTYMNGQYATLSGTSMGTPHVAGASALLLEKNEQEFGRTLSEPELYAQLVKHTSPLGYSKRTEGNGLLTLGVSDVPYDEFEAFMLEEGSEE